MATTDELLQRITASLEIYGGKPIIRGHRMAVEHVLGMMAAGDSADDLLRAIRGWNGKTSELVFCTQR